MPRSRVRLLILALVATLALTVVYVPAGQLAVRESYGGAVASAGPGLTFRVPLVQRLYRYDTLPVSIDSALPVKSKDNATFSLPVTISAWVSPGDLVTFHRSRAGREPRLYIEERVREALAEATGGMNADEILTPDVGRRLGPAVSADLITHGIADDGLKVSPPAPRVVLNAVLDYLKRRFPASARRLAERAVAADPREALYQTAMGMVLEAEGQAAGAEKAYLDALYLDPTAFEPMSRLYLMYQTTKDPEKIARLERLLEASLQKKKDSAMHHDWLGQVYLRLGRLDQAELAFQAAIGLAPRDPEYRISLGSLRVRQGKLDEARKVYEEALSLRPDQPLALFNLGATYAMQGQIDKALEEFHKAERAGAPNHALYNSLAQAYEQKGRLDRAAEYLKRSLALKPDQPERKAALKRIETQLKKRG